MKEYFVIFDYLNVFVVFYIVVLWENVFWVFYCCAWQEFHFAPTYL